MSVNMIDLRPISPDLHSHMLKYDVPASKAQASCTTAQLLAQAIRVKK